MKNNDKSLLDRQLSSDKLRDREKFWLERQKKIEGSDVANPSLKKTVPKK